MTRLIAGIVLISSAVQVFTGCATAPEAKQESSPPASDAYATLESYVGYDGGYYQNNRTDDDWFFDYYVHKAAPKRE